MEFLLDSFGVSKVFPLCFYDISMGLLLEFTWDFLWFLCYSMLFL